MPDATTRRFSRVRSAYASLHTPTGVNGVSAVLPLSAPVSRIAIADPLR